MRLESIVMSNVQKENRDFNNVEALMKMKKKFTWLRRICDNFYNEVHMMLGE